MKNKNNIKKVILGSFLGILIGSLLGTTYAMFTYERGGNENSKLITGNIYMKYKEDTTLTLHDAMPSNTYDSNNKFEFTIEGANTTTNKDVWYEIKVKRGDIPELTPTRSEENRIADKFIKYTLVEEKDGVETTVVDGESWEGLTTGKTIWVDKIERNKASETHKYTLYMWLSNKIEIGNSATADFTINDWNKAFASIKVDVNGDFTEKEVDEPYQTVNAMNTWPDEIKNNASNIKEVYFEKMDATTMNTRYNAATIKADLTYNNEGKVLAWLEPDTIDNTKNIMYVVSDGETYLTTGEYLFNSWTNLEKIDFNNINTSRVTNMFSMFANSKKIEILNLENFNMTSVLNFQGMFSNCSNINKIIFNNENIISPNDMNSMFYGCSSLKILDISMYSTQNLNSGSMGNIFGACASLEKIYVDPNKWNLSNQPNGMPVFTGCTALVGSAPNGTTYSFDGNDAIDKTYAVIATDTTKGYLTDISLKPNN